MSLIIIILLAIAAPPAFSQVLEGRVLDAVTGEALSRVRVEIADQPYRTQTGRDGGFSIESIPPGTYTLVVDTVGYRPLKQTLALPAATAYPVLDVRLQPDTLRHSDTLEVTAGPYAVEPVQAVSLAGSELRNLASVLADDPLRAVQGLPGVASNDDFQSEFSLRGAAFNRIGIYLDGILLHSPFHQVQGDNSSASITAIEGEGLEAVNLFSGPIPVQFGDRTAGALDMHTREGDRNRVSFRGTASASNATIFAEGPLGRRHRGSWLAGARKSYLQYIIQRTAADQPSLTFGFSDAQVKFSYDLTRSFNLAASLTDGHSGLDRTGASSGINSLITSDYHFSTAMVLARFTPTGSFFVQSRAAFLRERYTDSNPDRRPLAAGAYGEWSATSDATWTWRESATLEFGGSGRRLRNDAYHARLSNAAPFTTPVDVSRGTGLRYGGYVNQSFSLPFLHMVLAAGFRADAHSEAQGHPVSPSASAALQPWRGANLRLAWAQHVQYPELAQLFALAGNTLLLPERATHFTAALDQRLGDRTRIRLELYNRLDRDILFQPTLEPRLDAGRVVFPDLYPRWQNAWRGYSRGAEIFLQRRTSNGFSGWISYMYGVSRARVDVLGIRFPADFDQRHTINVYGSYRIRPTVNLSARYTYGSGFPVSGFFRGTSPTFFLSADRNQLRIPDYARADFRINKSWGHARWHFTLFGEVVNFTNRDNVRFEELSSYDARGNARLSFDRTFPILPSAGILVEY